MNAAILADNGVYEESDYLVAWFKGKNKALFQVVSFDVFQKAWHNQVLTHTFSIDT